MSASYHSQLALDTVKYNMHFQTMIMLFDAAYEYVLNQVEGNEEKEYWASLGYVKIYSFLLFSQNDFNLFDKHLKEEFKFLNQIDKLTSNELVYRDIIEMAQDIKNSIVTRFITGYIKEEL